MLPAYLPTTRTFFYSYELTLQLKKAGSMDIKVVGGPANHTPNSFKIRSTFTIFQ
jgi:hypothetical protein